MIKQFALLRSLSRCLVFCCPVACPFHPQIVGPDEIMFSGRLPDHLLHVTSVLDETASFEARVEQQEPLKHSLELLQRAKHALTEQANTPVTTGWWARAAPQGVHSKPDMLAHVDQLKSLAALAMRALWDSFLAWKDAEETVIANVKVLCCTVDVALKGFAKQANYPGQTFVPSASCPGCDFG